MKQSEKIAQLEKELKEAHEYINRQDHVLYSLKLKFFGTQSFRHKIEEIISEADSLIQQSHRSDGQNESEKKCLQVENHRLWELVRFYAGHKDAFSTNQINYGPHPYSE